MDARVGGGTAGLYGPESVSWQVNRETTVLFGGARALLMQAAHPLVLAGARQTGFYERNPWKRLERTLHLAYMMTFGTREEALEAARQINQVHRDVHGIDQVTGLPYDATDPDLLLWVHATLVDSQLLFERLTVGKLDEEGRERFHREQLAGSELLGLDPGRVPSTVAGLRRYIDDMVAGDTLRVTGETIQVADLIRRPPPEVPWKPVLRLISWWAFGTLPPRLRQAYGNRWNALEEIRLTTSLRALRLIRPLIPTMFREILPARLADQRAGLGANRSPPTRAPGRD